MKILFLVVTYQLPFNLSDTITSFIDFFDKNSYQQCDVKLVIWDNSVCSKYNELDDLASSENFSLEYIHTPENNSLSYIYNKISDNNSDFNYFTLLDHDTFLDYSYFTELYTLLSCQYNLILPQVYSKGVLISPATRFGCKGKLLNKLDSGLKSSKNMLAINSGMTIKGSVFNLIKYHNEIKFYGTDTWFMVCYEKNFSQLYVMKAKLKHDLRFNSENSYLWKKNYFKEQIRINNIIFNSNFFEFIFTKIYNLYLWIFYVIS